MSFTEYNIDDKAKDNKLNLARDLRELRRNTNKIKNELIKDFRVYYTTLPERALYPFDYQYAEIFYNLLRRKGLLCPIYHHLYIVVEKTMEDCLLRSVPYDDRYVNGLSIIDYNSYLNQTDVEKEQTVFSVIVAGLKDIADIDKLDTTIIDQTIAEIKIKGLDTELEHSTIDNEKYRLAVTYFSKSLEDGCPLYLNLFEKSSKKSNRIHIGIATKDQIYYWINSITITNKSIKIKSRSSAIADAYLKDKPRSLEFNIKEIING